MTTTIEKRTRIVTDELAGVKRLLDLYPTGILSMVSDTYDLWRMCTEYLPKLKDQILARDGKLVIRPDSGDPVDIICGIRTYEKKEHFESYKQSSNYTTKSEEKGVIELLWDIFGGTVNEQGYKVLDSHIGAIYGDSITLERAEQICARLKAKGFASTNVVFGIGSYTYQYNTRDTFGFAMKATYGEITTEVGEPINGERVKQTECREIYKAPITDSGEKKSKKGLLAVRRVLASTNSNYKAGDLHCLDQQTWEQEKTGLLQTVFLNGELTRKQTLEEIRHRLRFPNETLTVLEQK